MSATPVYLHWVSVLLLGLGAVGLWILWRGLRGRRQGDEIRCRRCGYNLAGIDSARCPECGTELTPANKVRGQRVRRPGLVVAGLVCLLLGGVVLVPGVLGLGRNIDWYRYRPAAWVISDLKSGVMPLAQKALAELERRDQAGGLSASHHNQLVEWALAKQVAPQQDPMTASMVDYLGGCCVAGRLDDVQQKQFLRGCMQFTLKVRPRVAEGDDGFYLIVESGRGPSKNGFWSQQSFDGVRLDGQDLPNQGGVSGSFSGSSHGGIGRRVKCKLAGKHAIEVIVRRQIRQGKFGDSSSRTWLDEPVTLTAEFEVLPQPAESLIAVREQPDLQNAFETSITPKEFTWAKFERNELAGAIVLDKIPASIAFEVFARSGEREQELGTLAGPAGYSSWFWQSTRWEGPMPEKVDIILRSSRKAAAGTVDLYEIWGGELLYRDVPVVDESKRNAGNKSSGQ